MKKIIFLATLLASFSLSMSAQNAYHAVGDKSICLSAGFGQTGLGAAVGFDYTLLDWGTVGSLSLGGYLGDSSENGINYMLIGPMVCYRYPVLENLDLSARTVLGWGMMSARGVNYSFFMRGIYFGGTYYLSDKIGIGAELGAGGATNASAHVSFRF